MHVIHVNQEITVVIEDECEDFFSSFSFSSLPLVCLPLQGVSNGRQKLDEPERVKQLFKSNMDVQY